MVSRRWILPILAFLSSFWALSAQASGFVLRSSAFQSGQAIPRQFTGEGRDLSPPLEWSGAPGKTRELALICDDPDAPGAGPWVHWVLFEIPPSVRALSAGERGVGVAGSNSWGSTGYRGPLPPPGSGAHHYHFKLYALDSDVALKKGASKEALLDAIRGHVLGTAELVGTYARSR